MLTMNEQLGLAMDALVAIRATPNRAEQIADMALRELDRPAHVTLTIGEQAMATSSDQPPAEQRAEVAEAHRLKAAVEVTGPPDDA